MPYKILNLYTFLNLPNKLLLSLILIPGLLFAQESTVAVDTTCAQQDLADVIRQARHKPPKAKPTNEGSLLLLPIIGSNPATGFMVGIGGQYAFKMPESTLYSFLSGSIQYTTKNQFIFMLKNNIYSRHNKIFYSGDWRYLIFSQSTYGLGTTAPEGGILHVQYNLGGLESVTDSLAQPMEFNFARLHQSMGFKVATGMYLGFGYQFDSYFKIVDQKLRLNPGDTLLTSHYAYNQYYGFDTEQYYSSAINAKFVIDTRDNMINAHQGYYLSVGWRGAFKFLGNRVNTNALQVEWRSFHPLSIKKPAHLLAFWVLADFTEKGDFPYMILPATAYDQRGRSARGYTQGRFRGNNFLYGEAEYRFPISPCGGILGGVIFTNVSTASNPVTGLKLFESLKPSIGTGLRIMVDKHSRTNLAIDFGFGAKSNGFYLAASETF